MFWSRTWLPNSWSWADQNERSSHVQTAKSECLRSYQVHEAKISKPRQGNYRSYRSIVREKLIPKPKIGLSKKVDDLKDGSG